MEPYIQIFIQKLETAINDKKVEIAVELTQEFFSKSFPCELILSNAEPISDKSPFEKYIESQEENKPSYQAINQKIFRKLEKAGHTREICIEASKNTLTLQEALKKIEALKKLEAIKKKKELNNKSKGRKF